MTAGRAVDHDGRRLAGDGFDDDARAAGGKRKRWRFLTEAFLLKSVFWALVAASVGFLGFDLHQIYQEADAALPGEKSRRAPVVQAPPKRLDQVRPYLPLTHPVRQKGKGPKLPGLLKPPGPEIVAARMSFVRGPKSTVSAIGRIEIGTADDLKRFLESQGGEIKRVYLHSPGGSVGDAVTMSVLLRQQGISTVVPDDGYCASSCPIVFSGGVKRLAGKRAWIGVHQIYPAANQSGSLSEGTAQAQFTTALIQETLGKHGVDVTVWNKAMLTPSDRLYIFTEKELVEFKLATKIGLSKSK